MLKHYLTVAFRNLWKYKTQSVISVIGLAVGFTCFALATLWIHYEMTYDDFHRDADRIYHVRPDKSDEVHGYKITSPWFLARFLKETFPEVEIACKTEHAKKHILQDGTTQFAITARVDSAFFKMFDVRLIEGNLDFLIWRSNKIAITEEQSKLLFGDKSPIGETINIDPIEYTICAVVSNCPKHSNIYFQFLEAGISDAPYAFMGDETFIKLRKGTDVKKFSEKLHDYKAKFDSNVFEDFIMTPITSLRYVDSNVETEIKFQYLLLFALIGILVIICALFNYISLFINRFRIRKKETALRIVVGASEKSLFLLFSTEYLSVLLFSFLLGLLLIKASLPTFSSMSGIASDISDIYLEVAGYMGSIIALSEGIFFILILAFRKRTLQASLKKNNKNVFRKSSIIIQLIISIGFIFCTIVMLKQLYFLKNVDMGADFKQTVSLNLIPKPDMKVLESQLKQIPEIENTISGNLVTLPHINYMSVINKNENHEFPATFPKEGLSIDYSVMTEENMHFYNMQLVAGNWVKDNQRNEIMINETAAKAFGWENPVGQQFNNFVMNSAFEYEKVTYTIEGVLKDINILPTRPVLPTVFTMEREDQFHYYSQSILFRYQTGKWKIVMEKINQLIEKEYPNSILKIENANEEFDKYLKTENMLMKLLSFVSLVCIIISIFGFFSLISLSCEERRKEIAIRKINGATMRDILNMYFKSYFSLLIIGSIVAFPIGYFIMKQWIEKYVKQIDISAWIYVAILLVMAFIIVLCVGWRVYKASIENPAEVIKTE